MRTRTPARALVRLMVANHRDEQGQIVFTFFPLLIGFFILGALAWDAGVWYFDHRTAQNQVDAAALAAVQELPSDDTTAAEDAAIAWLKRNGVDAAIADAIQVEHYDEADITSHCTQPELQPDEARVVFGAKADDGYHRVRVCLRRESLVLFSGLAGVTDAVVSAGGTANLTEQPVRYALMAMDPTGCDTLRLSGSGSGGGNLVVDIGGDGSTYTHSTTCTQSNSGALRASGGAQLIANCINPPEGGETCGAHEVRSNWTTSGGGSITPAPVYRSAPMPDPFADVELPTPGSCATQSPLPNPLPPGTYCNKVQSNDPLVLSGGTYIFMNGLSLQSKGSITTDNPSLIYITCAAAEAGTGGCTSSQNFGVTSDPESGISVCVNGLISGPGVDECPFPDDENPEDVTCAPLEMECLAIVVSRNFGGGNCVDLSGKGSFQIFGNIYAIDCTITMSGQSGQTNELNATIVADHIDFTGQAAYEVNWNSTTAPKDLIIALVE